MQMIAKRAKASNETLYRWYGDKVGLFSALVSGNAAQIKGTLEQALSSTAAPLPALEKIAPDLLAMLTSERAIALNRAAAGDATGKLGQELAQAGRMVIGPLLAQLFMRLKAEGILDFDDAKQTTRLFIDLLVGDHQIRRVTGAIGSMSPQDQAARAANAIALITQLHAPKR